MKKKFFVTATDTEVGKTFISSLILKTLNKFNLKTAALKPVAAGCVQNETGMWVNEDALTLKANCSLDFSYRKINPYALPIAASPHIAAAKANKILTSKEIVSNCQAVLNANYDCLLIEGAGGWFAPISNTETMADLAREFSAQVIMVVSMQLGCLNHASLTAKAIENSGLKLYGWIANCKNKEMPWLLENIEYLKNNLPAPLLMQIPYIEDTNDYFLSAKDISWLLI